jgi:hypothetical protein
MEAAMELLNGKYHSEGDENEANEEQAASPNKAIRVQNKEDLYVSN